MVRSRGQKCGDMELTGYLVNTVDPVSLVLDLRLTQKCWGSNSDPTLNGNLHYPNDIDRSLNETVDDKIRKYHLIGKLTVFLQLQEFSLRKQTVDYSTSVAPCSPHRSKTAVLRVNLILDGKPITSRTHILTHHTRKHLAY